MTENSSNIFEINDPIGNTVKLSNDTLQFHIAGESGDHPDRNFLVQGNNLNKISSIIQNPTMILKDKNFDNKINHFGTTMFESQNTIKNVKIVSELGEDGEYQIATIIPTKSLNEKFEGRILYDLYSNKE